MDNSSLVSVIVPVWLPKNNQYWWYELLGYTSAMVFSLRRQSRLPFELVLVDNGSNYGTTVLKPLADRYIHFKKNKGYGPAVNKGVQEATGEFVVVANNDLFFVHDWLSMALTLFQQDATIGAISAHQTLKPVDFIVTNTKVVVPGEMFGALWAMRKQVYLKLKGLDESFLWGMWEDRDLWFRLKQNNYTLVKAGVVMHVGNATWGKIPGAEKIFTKNKRRFFSIWGVENS